MKKLLALLLCLSVMLCMVACGAAEEKKSEKTETKTTSEDGSDPAGESQDAESSELAEESQDASQEGSDTAEESQDAESSENAEEAHDHNHIGYKGQVTVFTPDALAQIEGKECDFTYEQNGSTIYIYNAVEADGMSFTQAQFTFSEDHNRISCTYTVGAGTEEAPKDEETLKAEVSAILSSYEQSLVSLYGEGTRTEQHGYELVSWMDHTGNYIILTQINEKTVQVAYYIYAK